MIISCPSCGVSFSVKSEALGAAGRRVKCSKCGHQWHAIPEGAETPEAEPTPPPPIEPDPPPAPAAVEPAVETAEEPAVADSPEPPFAAVDEPEDAPAPLPEAPEAPVEEVIPEFAPVAEADAAPEADDSASLDEIFGAAEQQDEGPSVDATAVADDPTGPEDIAAEAPTIEPPAAAGDEPDFPPPPTAPAVDISDDEPQPARRRAGFVRAVSLAALILLIAGIGVGLFFMQSKIVMWFPASSKIYAMVGLKPDILGQGLQIIEPTPKKQIDGDDEILLVEGEISNTTNRQIAIPLMRGALLDKFGKELHVWTFSAAKQDVSPGGSAAYSTQFRNPPAAAERLDITFTRPGEGDSPVTPAQKPAANGKPASN